MSKQPVVGKGGPSPSLAISVTKSFTFDAAHELPWHAGKCKNLHGHTYRFEITIERQDQEVDMNGIVIDFDNVTTIVKMLITERLDHKYLNDLVENPTAEVLAAMIWETVGCALPDGFNVKKVRLWETPNCSATIERTG